MRTFKLTTVSGVLTEQFNEVSCSNTGFALTLFILGLINGSTKKEEKFPFE